MPRGCRVSPIASASVSGGTKQLSRFSAQATLRKQATLSLASRRRIAFCMTENDGLAREASAGPIFHPDWGTHAYERYNGHIRGLEALLAMVFPIAVDTERSTRYLTARRLRIEGHFSGPWAMDVRHTMLSWQVAMRVSAVEVYLQNALTFLAVYDAEFMRSRGSKQEWDYEAIRSASDNDDTLWTFCNRWARSFIGDGGPQRWCKSLQKSGLGEFSEEDVSELEVMWGFRHMQVHHAGQFTREFISRHPTEADRLWRHGLQLEDLERWSAAVGRFVDAAEQGIAGRLKARLGPDLIDRRMHAEAERQMTALRERRDRITSAESEEDRNARIAKHMAALDERIALMGEVFDVDMPASPSPPPEEVVS